MLDKKTTFTLIIAFIFIFPLSSQDSMTSGFSMKEVLEQAKQNGILANEGFRRSNNYLHAWLSQTDSKTGLIPKNLDWKSHIQSYKKGGKDVWNAKDAAADNYSYMVLTASITDHSLFEGRLLDMLNTEIKLTSRVDRMPDTYVFSKGGFKTEVPDLNSMIFGSSEYVKDGLLPMTEWLGPSPWSERMLGILDDIWKNASIATPYGMMVSKNVEVNGEMLQTLARVYWMTGDRKYLEWALRIGDYYLLGNKHPTRDFSSLRLRDHGCEIISGLCELYATVHFALPNKKTEYEKSIHRMLDRILVVGRNEHGLFYNIINPKTGEIIDKGIADTWGYTYNGYYTVYLIDKKETYRQAILNALSSLNENYRNYLWEGTSSDGYADSIESAINLYNREPVASVAGWVDSEIQVMWSKQKETGLIEGWHCDGNFARTSLQYGLWKTRGVTIQPWREDVILGAVSSDAEIWLCLIAGVDWSGKIRFDTPRHKRIMKLPLDWPRINQWQEWFVVESGEQYVLENSSSDKKVQYLGQQLQSGIDVSVKAGKEVYLHMVRQPGR